MKLLRKIALPLFFFAAMIMMSFAAFAGATYSSAWFTQGNNWYLRGPNGQTVKNAWVCDNGVGPGSQNNWYLIDSNGCMVAAPLVQDGTGNYYSLETSHNGYYGMLRYTSGTYDGIYLSFNTNNNGSFGAITNQDGINALRARYGVYSVAHINNANCIYTADYATPSGQSITNYTYQINYYVNGSKYTSKQGSSRNMTVLNYSRSNFLYWEESNTGDIYYPGENYYFSGAPTVRMNAVFSSSINTNKYILTYYYKNGYYYKEQTSSTGRFTVAASPGRYQDMPFKYWVDESGTPWYPGENYTSRSYYHTLTAVYDPFEYGGNADDDYYDDYDDYYGGIDIW